MCFFPRTYGDFASSIVDVHDTGRRSSAMTTVLHLRVGAAFVTAMLMLVPKPAWAAGGADSPAGRLVILSDTGRLREGLPVLTRHPNPGPLLDVLQRGYSGKLIRLYALEQAYLYRAGRNPAEPAYLLLSNRQGGFPRFGFYLDDEAKRGVGYVDLHVRSQLTGRFGAVDQIFPHELMHVIVQQLAGEPPPGGANQVHAIGVRTDPQVAFSEGFAEHAQIMAVDDPDAAPATHALATRADILQSARADLDAYVRELSAAIAPASRARMRFLFWFSQDEQVLRYHAVKANLFVREPAIPANLLDRDDRYPAYLLSSILPGSPGGELKSAGVALSTEGVVSHLFWRWVGSEAIRSRYREATFYERFGITAGEVSPAENAYLKLFHALAIHKPHDAAATVAAYIETYPDEADALRTIVSDSLGGQRSVAAPELWLANASFQTGTTLFDQFRSTPRPHTFDVNAATAIDWLGVPGVSRELAERLVRGVPYRALGEIDRVPGMEGAISSRVTSMASAMRDLQAAPEDRESSVSIWGLLRGYVWRAAAIWLIATLTGTVAGAKVRKTSAMRALPRGAAASLLVLAFTWVVVGPGWLPPVLVPALFAGMPAALWQLARQRTWRFAATGIVAWVIAAVPAALLTRAWF
jgi:hypothetical protein